MDWQIKPFSRKCAVSGQPFSSGDRYLSILLVATGDNQIERVDIHVDREADFPLPGRTICRWTRVYEPPERDESGETIRKTAEDLFLALNGELPEPPARESDQSGADPLSPESLDEVARAALRQILGLLLERRRVLKTRGYTPDGNAQIMEHRKLGEVYLVPTGEPQPEVFLRIEPFLQGLVKSDEKGPSRSEGP